MTKKTHILIVNETVAFIFIMNVFEKIKNLRAVASNKIISYDYEEGGSVQIHMKGTDKGTEYVRVCTYVLYPTVQYTYATYTVVSSAGARKGANTVPNLCIQY